MNLNHLNYYHLLPVYRVRSVKDWVFIKIAGGPVIKCAKDHQFVPVRDKQPGREAVHLSANDLIWVDLQDDEGLALSLKDQQLLDLLKPGLDTLNKGAILLIAYKLRAAYVEALLELEGKKS